jgi:Vitamin-D-receptor interacting Mediator subunit 4
MTEWLNPLAGVPSFVPWPTEETIKRGALASIQVLLDQGVDPATFDPERAAELEAERQRVETEKEAERERLELEKERERERGRIERIERERERAERRESMGMSGAGSGVGAESKPAVFMGLDLLDEDED